MRNFEKYKSAEERTEAFNRFCESQKCEQCQLYDGCNDLKIEGCFGWLDLEAEEEKPLPCPFCGGYLIPFDLSRFSFVCDCGYHTKICKNKNDAIAAHNRVAKAVKESEAS